MLIKSLEIFLFTFAYSVWPFVFILLLMYLRNKYFTEKAKVRNKKEKKLRETHDDIPIDPSLMEDFSFRVPKIETSFGDRRIGEVHEHEKKN